MESLTVVSSMLTVRGKEGFTPAMLTALWVIADEIDSRRLSKGTSDAVWLTIPTVRLRGDEGRSDNIWLRECLRRLTGFQIDGTFKGDPWGAVMVAEWHIEEGGTVARILVPPAAIRALLSQDTFAKIEAHAAFKLNGPARRLYAALADKKRMGNPYWTYELDELRRLLGVDARPSYDRWSNFRQWILDPALAEINDFGTVTVKPSFQKTGRSVTAVRFDWQWKTIDQARHTEEENERHSMARNRDQLKADAPPLTGPLSPQEAARKESLRRKLIDLGVPVDKINVPSHG